MSKTAIRPSRNWAELVAVFAVGIGFGIILSPILRTAEFASVGRAECKSRSGLLDVRDLTERKVNHYPFTATKKVFLDAGNVSEQLLQVATAQFPPGSSFEAHKHHDMAEIFFGVAGHGVINVDGTEHTMQAGRMIAVAKGSEHSGFVPADASTPLEMFYFGVAAQQLDKC